MCIFLKKEIPKKFLRPLQYALVAVIIAFIFSIVAEISGQHLDERFPHYSSDGEEYWNLSENLLSKHAFMNGPGYEQIFTVIPGYSYSLQRVPGYPLYLAFSRSVLMSDDPKIVALANLPLVFLFVFFSILFFEAYVLGKPSKYHGWYILFALYPQIHILSSAIQSDLLAGTFLVLFTYTIVRTDHYRFLAVLFGSAAVFTRTNTLFYVVPLLASLFIWGVYQKNIQERLRFCVVTLLSFLFLVVCMGGWTWRNYTISGHRQFTSLTWYNLPFNYQKQMLWDVSKLARRVQLFSSIKQKNVVLLFISQNELVLRTAPRSVDSTTALAPLLDDQDMSEFIRLFSQWAAEVVQNQDYYARWSSVDPAGYGRIRFQELLREGTPYEAEYQLYSQVKRDTAQFVMENKLRTLSQVLVNTVRFHVYDLYILVYLRNHLFGVVGVAMMGILLVWYVIPAVAFWGIFSRMVIKKKFSLSAAVMGSSAMFSIGTLLILGIKTRFMFPVSSALVGSAVFMGMQYGYVLRQSVVNLLKRVSLPRTRNVG